MEIEQEQMMGLPSVGFNSSPTELYQTYLEIEKIRHPFDEQDDNFQTHFNKFIQIESAIYLGLVKPEEISNALEGLLRDPNPEELMDVSRFWCELAKEYPSVNRYVSDAKLAWKNGIDKETNVFKAASLTTSYLKGNSGLEKADKEILQDFAEKIRGQLPNYDSLNELDKQLKDVMTFVTNSRNLGVNFPDLEKYLLNLPTNILFDRYGMSMRSFLFFVNESSLDQNSKLNKIMEFADLAKNMPTEDKDTVLEVVVQFLSILHEHELAIEIWKEIETPMSILHSLSDLAESYMKDRTLEKPNFREEANSDNFVWSLRWYFAAKYLAENDKVYGFDQPEVVNLISSGHADYDLTGLARMVTIFPDQKNLKQLVFQRLEERIKKFNLGQLDDSDAGKLVESLMILKSKKII